MRIAPFAGLLFASLLSFPALAQDDISMEAVTRVAQGEGAPRVTFHSRVLGRLDVSLACSGRRYTLSESIEPGGSYTLSMTGLSAGAHPCKGQVVLRNRDGGEGTMPLSFEVAVLTPPELRVDQADLDLEARSLVLQSDRPIADVKIEVFGLGGASIGGGRLAGNGLTRLPVSWTSEGEILKIVLTVEDGLGAFAALTLQPWSYQIPHEDVIFESNQAEILPAEVPRLEAAWTEVEATLAKYGDVVDIELYVSGYTDTVGTADHNLDLSRRRARAIAEWFRTRGFAGRIAYQGFGEGALAVPTPDGTDEAANRRAVYVLSASPPPVSILHPRADWAPLR